MGRKIFAFYAENFCLTCIFKFPIYRKMNMDPGADSSVPRVDPMPITAVILCLVNAYVVMDTQVQCVTGPVLMAPMAQDAH